MNYLERRGRFIAICMGIALVLALVAWLGGYGPR